MFKNKICSGGAEVLKISSTTETHADIQASDFIRSKLGPHSSSWVTWNLAHGRPDREQQNYIELSSIHPSSFTTAVPPLPLSLCPWEF